MLDAKLQGLSDAFFAIIITIMVLELKFPHGTSWAVIEPLVPVFLSYLLSFIYLGVYWGNHHQLMLLVRKVTPAILWTNMNLLFWISLVPFVTGWMGTNHFDRITVAAYGALILICGISLTTLTTTIRRSYHVDTRITRALDKRKRKSFISRLLYLISIPIALFVHPIISAVLFAIVAVWWIIPDREIDHVLNEEEEE